MVEIEQEELERLKDIENKYNTLLPEHEELVGKHNSLKDDYISLSKGQQTNGGNKQDDFDEYCSNKFKK